ncbi:MAG: Mov34/MPN/PAD-1 family protein [Planctomycetes bacterium]|nr:Mov34/MPN/PAD-1 family protein [Planctomycetota bacterium]MCB9909520.1 Mov34/MPN/PAD-1 family protein [Planctomycetota bacterium]
MWQGALGPLSTQTQGLLGAWSQAALPREACGLLVGCWRGGRLEIRHVTLARNVATKPEAAFRVDAGHLMEVDRWAVGQGLRLVGAWHSHPTGDSAPSSADHEGLQPGWLGLLVVPGGEPLSPRVVDYGSPYEPC